MYDQINKTTTNRQYDDNDQMIEEKLGNDLKIQYEYDRIGRTTKILMPDETAVSHSYKGHRLNKITRLENEIIKYSHSYDEFDLSGNVLRATLIGQADLLKQRYDLLSRNSEITHQHWIENSFLYDKVGNLLEKNISDSQGFQPYRYTYDALDQLMTETGAVSHQYANDSLYNRVEKDGKSHQINHLNQLIHDGEKTLTYDQNGNLRKIDQNSKEIHYTYDALNRLTERIADNQCHRYTYDSFNRRLSKEELILKSGIWHSVHRIHYLYQGQNEIGAWENESLTELRLLGLSKGAEIGASVAIELNGHPYAPIHDHNGNIVCLLDAQTGSIAATYRYTAFGEEQSFSSVKNPWRYASKRVDDESGLIYFGRRYYAPQFGRWITPDPIGFEDGPNLYAYVHNRPLTHFDEYGLEAVGEGSGFFGFTWGSFYNALCSACSATVNSCCDVGMGAFNGFVHPLDTTGSWINGNPNETSGSSPSVSTRIGEALGVGLLVVSVAYTGGISATAGRAAGGAAGGVAARQVVVQGTRMVGRRMVGESGRRVIADAMAESAVVECPTSVATTEIGVAAQVSRESVTLNRFHQAASRLDKQGKNNIRILRRWAKNKGWVRASNNGGPEKWGTLQNGEFEWNLRIKPEGSFRTGLKEGSNVPRFHARLGKGGDQYINPFTGKTGNVNAGKHLPLEITY